MLTLRFWEKPVANPDPQRAPIHFLFQATSYDKIQEETQLKLKRRISKSGNSFLYEVLFDTQAPNPAEIKTLEKIKHKIITLLSSSESKNENSFDFALSVATSELSTMPSSKAQAFALLLAYDITKYGPIGILLEDKENIEEIEVNSPALPIYIYHSKYGRCVTNLKFTGEKGLINTLNRFIYDSEKELNEDTPIVDVQVDDSRVHAQLSPYSANGPCATIRIGGKKELNLVSLSEKGMASFQTLAYLWLASDVNANIIVAGAPAAGKTTLLSAILCFLPRYKRIVAVEEDVNELKFTTNLTGVCLYGSKKGGISTKDQVINALRMRPEMLIVGEIRGEEAKDLFSGANLGIPFITTMHSNDGGISIIKKLLVKPMSVEANAISALDISIQMSNAPSKRSISEINEYRWLSRAETSEEGTHVGDDLVSVAPIVFNSAINPKNLKNSKVIERFSTIHDLSVPQVLDELKKRADFLRQICSSTKSTLDLIEKISNYGG